jgi:hypothetical protein
VRIAKDVEDLLSCEVRWCRCCGIVGRCDRAQVVCAAKPRSGNIKMLDAIQIELKTCRISTS